MGNSHELVPHMHHVGIIVSDLERSLKFYRDVLGFEVVEEVDLIEGKKVSLGVGIDDARLQLAHLRVGSGPTRIELLHYISPKGKPLSPNTRSNDIGVGHAAFRVRDIQKYYERLKSAGVRFISAIQESSTREKFCYFYDPDGAILEIIEPPEGPLKSVTE